MEREKKISFGLKKTKYMIVKTGREEKKLNETVQAGRIKRTVKCKYPGMTISTDGQLTENIKNLTVDVTLSTKKYVQQEQNHKQRKRKLELS